MEFLPRFLQAGREDLHISHSVVRDSHCRALLRCAKRPAHHTDHSEIDLPRSSLDLPFPNRHAALRWKSCMNCNDTRRRTPELSSFLLFDVNAGRLVSSCAMGCRSFSREWSPVAGGS